MTPESGIASQLCRELGLEPGRKKCRTPEERRAYNTAYARAWRAKHGDRMRATSRKSYRLNRLSRLEGQQRARAKHPEKYRAYVRAYHHAHRSRLAILKIERAFGLSSVDYAALLARQRRLCAICARPEQTMIRQNGLIRQLSVDHDHKTGAVRGLLCQSCNHGLGKFGDDPVRLQAAIAYLAGVAMPSR